MRELDLEPFDNLEEWAVYVMTMIAAVAGGNTPGTLNLSDDAWEVFIGLLYFRAPKAAVLLTKDFINSTHGKEVIEIIKNEWLKDQDIRK